MPRDTGRAAPEYQIHVACALDEGVGIGRVRGQVVVVEACEVKWLIVYLHINHAVCKSLQVCQDLLLNYTCMRGKADWIHASYCNPCMNSTTQSRQCSCQLVPVDILYCITMHGGQTQSMQSSGRAMPYQQLRTVSHDKVLWVRKGVWVFW